ncbi:conserved hypothetical protein [Flavobacterium sp. 9AF]|uniref:hypothetical protein n=1 Tax=Flavobacterium sp. 9AF TaxID=2653142 RepID=UPI0012F448A5|nr:hypothetical protein [Flavobacterium sp. 9AF]VXB37178.1 conserved hypothetical protein [Flavobacterium sp. 9AF]
MKKLYTLDNKNITVYSEFDIKFSDFLSFLKEADLKLHNLFYTNENFNLEVNKFKNIYSTFLKYWLKDNFNFNQNLSTETLQNLIDKVSTTDVQFSELFAYFKLYKKIVNTENRLYITYFT